MLIDPLFPKRVEAFRQFVQIALAQQGALSAELQQRIHAQAEALGLDAETRERVIAEVLASQARHQRAPIALDNIGQLDQLAEWSRDLPVYRLAFSPDGRQLAVASWGVWLCDGQTLNEIRQFVGFANVTSIAFAPRGDILACGLEDCSIRLCRVRDGQCLHTLRGHKESVCGLAFLRNQSLASVSSDGMVKAWSSVDGSEELLILPSSMKYSKRVQHVAFWANRSILAIGDECYIYFLKFNDLLMLWRIKVTLQEMRAVTFDFNPSGYILALAQGNRISLRRTVDGNELRALKTEQSVSSLAFNQDGSILATGLSNGKVQLWRVADGKLVHELATNKHGVTCVTFNPDGSLLASGSNDGTVRLWGVPR